MIFHFFGVSFPIGWYTVRQILTEQKVKGILASLGNIFNGARVIMCGVK